jgi:glycerol uptake operon antiterminator
MDRSLGARLTRHPVIATLYGVEQIDAFIDSEAEVSIVANVELRKLQPVIATLTKAGKYVIVNIDSCEGLSQDKGGVEYLADIGVTSLVSTRVATIQRANRAGMVTMQKVFVTDRSTWPRSVKALEQSDPNLVQLMPAPMLSHLPEADRKALPPIVTSGFVCNQDDIRSAIAHGAVAISTSDRTLWHLQAAMLKGDAPRAKSRAATSATASASASKGAAATSFPASPAAFSTAASLSTPSPSSSSTSSRRTR